MTCVISNQTLINISYTSRSTAFQPYHTSNGFRVGSCMTPITVEDGTLVCGAERKILTQFAHRCLLIFHHANVSAFEGIRSSATYWLMDAIIGVFSRPSSVPSSSLSLNMERIFIRLFSQRLASLWHRNNIVDFNIQKLSCLVHFFADFIAFFLWREFPFF